MSGQVNKPNLSIKSRPALFYAIIGAAIVIILAVIAISIKLVYSNAANEGADDTGVATLDSVEITQAGTGQSVTIKGETLNENDYGTDNAARRTILNNNVVRYNVNYNVTTPGRVTLSITMPANNVIDEATIAESQHCLPGLSKLEPADITNSDGTVTKSYTNNKATCVRDIADIGNTNWQITAYAWGANNARIQPTLAVSGVSQDIKPEAITVVGVPNYQLYTQAGVNYYTSDGINFVPRIEYGLYIPITKGVNGDGDAVIGVEPLNDTITFTIDASQMPEGWYPMNCDGQISMSGNLSVHEKFKSYGNRSCQRDGDNLNITVSNVATATRDYGSELYGISGWADGYAFYFVGGVNLASPVSSIPLEDTWYQIAWGVQYDESGSGQEVAITSNLYSLGWNLSSRSYANPRLYFSKKTGWDNNWGDNWPLYSGESTYLEPAVSGQSVPASNYATNMQYCVTWRGDQVAPTGVYNVYSSVVMNSQVDYEFGVLGNSDSIPPESKLSYCGVVGDVKTDASFFADYNQAEEYANSLGLHVNAIRIKAGKVRNGAAYLGNMPFAITANISDVAPIVFNYSMKTDQYSTNLYGTPTETSWSQQHYLVPGLLTHTITAVPSSANPGNEDHITITTKTYNKDTNSKVAVDLPAGLTPKAGSFTITTGYTHNDVTNTNEPNKAVLVEGDGQDYTLSSGCDTGDGCTVIFDLDHIAAAHNVPVTGYDPIYPGQSGVTNIILNSDTGLYEEVTTTNNNNTDDDIINDDLPIAADNNSNGIVHANTPIEFDVTINEDTPSPSTLTINSTTSGDGTKYAAASFKSASDTIAVAEPPRTFGYNLTADKNNIYAGEELTYTYNISNLTSDTTTDIAMVAVLPFNGDSRGTAGLADRSDGANPYTISNLTLSLSSDEVDGLDTSAIKLYYTPDAKVRELEPDNPEALATDDSIAWQELVASSTSADGNAVTFTIPSNIANAMTAIKLVSPELASEGRLKLNMTLDNILAATPGGRATLGNDITYLAYTNPADSLTDTTSTQAMPRTILRSSDGVTAYSNGQVTSVHKSLVTTGYLGELLSLSIPADEQTIQVELNPNEVVIGDDNNLVNHLSLNTATLRGYNLTARTGTDDGKLLSADQARFIPAVPTQPVATTAGWSAKVIGSNNPSLTATSWAAIPGSNQTPLNLYASTTKGREDRRLTVTYGFSAGDAVAGEYSANVIYTLTAEP